MKKDFLPAYLVLLSLTTFCILASSQTNASFPSKSFLLTEEEKKNKASQSEEKKKASPVEQEKKKEEPFFKGGFFVSKTPIKKIAPTPEKSIEIKGIDEWEKMPAPTLWTVDKLEEHPLCLLIPSESLKHVKNGMWFSHLWNNKEKSVQYLKLVMSRLNLEDCVSSETSMISFNAMTDLRIALLYTLTQCKPGLPILDVGSGYGFMARNMLTLGANVRLVDNNQKSLELAAKHFEEKKEFLPSNYKSLYILEKSDIKDKNAPFYRQKYWVVNCEHLLHFMPPSEIHAFLDRIYETLYPGGLFFANVVAVFMTQERINEYLEGRKLGKEFPFEGQYRPNSKEAIYDILIALEELTNVIKKHGFFIEKSFYTDSLGNETNKDCFTPNPIGQTVSSCVIARRPLNTIPKEIIFEPVQKKTELIEKKEEKPFFKGGFFVTPPKMDPEIKIEEKKEIKWDEMKMPDLWSLDNLKAHPFYSKISSDELLFGKFILWYAHLWNKEKRLQYLQAATKKYPLTSMPSYNEFTNLRLELLFTLSQCPSGLPVLEIGGGFGFMARNMMILGTSLTMVDISAEKLEFARKHFEQHRNFFPQNYKELYTPETEDIMNDQASFYKKKYWMVNCERVLQFISSTEREKFAKDIYEVLYPGGLFFISIPTSAPTFLNPNELMTYEENSFKDHPFEHLKIMLKKNGFLIEKSFHVDVLGNKTDKIFSIHNPEGQAFSSCLIARKPTTIKKEIPVKTEEKKPLIKKGFFLNSTPPKKEPEIKTEEKKAPSQPFFKGGFFVTKSPLQNPPSKKAPEPIIEIKKVDKWSQMEAPKLWTVDELKFHPLCWKTNQMDSNALQCTKNVLWFSQLWNDKQKSKKYFDVVMNYQLNKTELSEYVNFETSMPSIIQLNDLRISLLYTLTETKSGIPILDLGGGFGFSALNMLILKANVTLVDKSQESLKQAKLHFEKHKEFLPENYTDLCTLEKSDFTDGNAPFYRQKYWIVNCEQILDLLLPDQINILLGRIYEVLHPGGFLFTSVITAFFNQEDINEYNEYVERYKKGKEFSIEKKFKLQSTLSDYLIFKLSNELANIIQKHGFIIEDSFNMDIMGNKLKNPFISTPEIGMTTKVGIIARKPFNTEKK